ncbi:Protein of unknown function [Gryllus bimaculatus]|nr:Protein of unknown function [Gryllus bimaculatus]
MEEAAGRNDDGASSSAAHYYYFKSKEFQAQGFEALKIMRLQSSPPIGKSQFGYEPTGIRRGENKKWSGDNAI